MKFLRLIMILTLMAHFEPSLAETGSKKRETSTKSRSNGKIQRMFKKASKLYQRQKYDEASYLYTKILRSQPGHKQAKLYLAKSLYKRDKINQSYRLFKQLDLKTLDPESSYEYGQSFFKHKMYEGALKAFKRVPSDSPSYDLSSYYGGVSAYKLKRFKEAVKLFNQAVVLPSKLMSNKKSLQKQASSKVLAEQKATPRNNRIPIPQQESKKPQRPKPEISSASKKGFLSPINDLGIEAKAIEQNNDYSSIKTESSNSQAVGARLNLGLDKTFGKKGNHFVGQLSVLGASATRTNRIVNTSIDYKDEAQTIIFNRTTEVESLVDAKISLSPEFYIGNQSWAALDFFAEYISVEGLDSNEGVIPGASLLVGRKGETFTFQLVASFLDFTLNENSYYQRTIQSVGVRSKLNSKFSVSVKGSLSQFTYTEIETDGPDWLGTGYVAVVYQEDKPFSARLFSSYEQYGAYRLYNRSEEYNAVEFDFNGIGGGLMLAANLNDWLQVTGESKVLDRKITKHSPAEDNALVLIGQNFPTYIVSSSVNLKVSYQF